MATAYADFTYTPTYPTGLWSPAPFVYPPTPNNRVVFYDKSVGPTPATSWTWKISNEVFSTDQNAVYTFENAGTYIITLDVSGVGWSAQKVLNPFTIYPYVLPSLAVPFAGQQFFDNDGLPLANGWVHSYAAGGYSNKLKTYDRYNVVMQHPSAVQLDADGRYLTEDVRWGPGGGNTIPLGTNYNFVVTQPDGETVVQKIDNIYTPAYVAGENVRVEGYDIVNQYTFTVSSTTPDVRFGRGDTYLFWAETRTPFYSNGFANNDLATIRKTPVADPQQPNVEYIDFVGYVFRKAGAYQIKTQYNLAPVDTFSQGVWVLGTEIKVASATYPLTKSFDTRYTNSTFTDVPVPYDITTTVENYVVSVAAGDVLTIGPYVIDENNNAFTAKGALQITRIGEPFTPVQVPVAAFETNTLSGGTPLTVQFYNTSTNNPTFFYWVFGDGTTSTLSDPTHTYTTAGDFIVKFYAGNSAGWTATPAVNTIHTTSTLTADFSPRYGVFDAFGPGGTGDVQFFDASTNAVQWQWDFGDGTTSTEQSPLHTYHTGSYTVTLTVADVNGTWSTPAYGYLGVGGAVPVVLTPFDVTNTMSATQNTVDIQIPTGTAMAIQCGTCNLPGTVCNGDSFIRLFDPNGVEVAFNDDDYLTSASFISYDIVTPGTHILKVGAYAAQSCTGVAGWQLL